MSPQAEHPADSAGVPWEGRSFEPNPHSGDDGSADPALLAALTAFHAGQGDAVAVVEAYRTARLLIPLVAETGSAGQALEPEVGPYGLPVDKTQELSIVTVAGPGGRARQPRWNPAVHERRVVADTHRKCWSALRRGGQRDLRLLERRPSNSLLLVDPLQHACTCIIAPTLMR